jgi:hypothetical protein
MRKKVLRRLQGLAESIFWKPNSPQDDKLMASIKRNSFLPTVS